MNESTSRKFGITKASVDLITRLKERGLSVTAAVFGSPYSMPQFADADAIVCGYQDIDGMQRVVPQILFGALGARGVLPVSVGAFKAGLGYLPNPEGRLSTGSPESVGMKSSVLEQIDAIAQSGVRGHAVPGCQILVARKGKVVYNKNFGALTYAAGAEKVTDETLYDLASLTKVLATLQSVMVLYDRKQLDLVQKASFYLPELRGTNKQNFTVQDLLWHQSGMVSGYAATWDRTRNSSGSLKADYYATVPDSLHTLQIAPTLWGIPALRDSVWKWVVFSSPMSRKIDASGQPGYLYSDLNFLTLQKIVERISKQPLNEFVTKNVYRPLGLHQIGFTPLQRLKDPHCAPTEQDTYYRNQLLVGTVHDQMAAVQGGISGHAGLFSNARDVAVLLQMNLQKGLYGEQRVLNPMTVPYFTQTLSNRSFRSLGWDKPDPGTPSSSYRASQASPRSFGHTGFTGNMVWVDPDQELVFVFLSNRVYPSAGNNAINTTKLRRRIHELVYAAVQ